MRRLLCTRPKVSTRDERADWAMFVARVIESGFLSVIFYKKRLFALSDQEGWTHSVVPSAQCSFFQIGTISLRRSIANRQASNAWARCGQLTATATLISPTSR